MVKFICYVRVLDMNQRMRRPIPQKDSVSSSSSSENDEPSSSSSISGKLLPSESLPWSGSEFRFGNPSDFVINSNIFARMRVSNWFKSVTGRCTIDAHSSKKFSFVEEVTILAMHSERSDAICCSCQMKKLLKVRRKQSSIMHYFWNQLRLSTYNFWTMPSDVLSSDKNWM